MLSSQTNKELAVQFFNLIVSGRIDEAYEVHVDMSGKHHNVFTQAGFLPLREAMKENDAKFPNKSLTIKNVLGDGDFVAVHSHLVLTPGESGMTVVHLLRFKDEKIIELWDCGQLIPADCPNTDGAF